MVEVTRRRRAGEAHVHAWRLEAPNGPIAIGVCACGAEREFENAPAADSSHFNGRPLGERTKRMSDVERKRLKELARVREVELQTALAEAKQWSGR